MMASTAGAAAEWPTRPIRIIAPSTPGGAADTFARLLAEFLPPLLHQPLVVDNRAGAGGLIGVAAAAHAEPDGYTLVTSSVGYLAVAPAVSQNPGFDPIRDLTHIAYLGGPPNVFVVHPSLGARSLKELIALAHGRQLDYVSPGVGSLGNILMEYFAQQAGIKMQHIPHKGSSQATMDLIAGTVKVGSMTWSSAIGQNSRRRHGAAGGVVARPNRRISSGTDAARGGLRRPCCLHLVCTVRTGRPARPRGAEAEPGGYHRVGYPGAATAACRRCDHCRSDDPASRDRLRKPRG